MAFKKGAQLSALAVKGQMENRARLSPD